MCWKKCSECCGCGNSSNSNRNNGDKNKDDNTEDQEQGDMNPHPPPSPPTPPSPNNGPDFSGGGGSGRRIRRLWCQTGYDIAVYPNGTVRGTKSPKNKYALLEFEVIDLIGHLRIKGLQTQFYITMNRAGHVHAQPLANNPGTTWIETNVGSASTYHSLLSLDFAHKGYYLGLKRNGQPKEGPKTAHPYPQKATSFLSRIITET